MDPTVGVVVCVCTHRRPEALGQLLGRLADQTRAPEAVVVVDNDPAASARGVVAHWSPPRATDVHYAAVPVRGLSAVRNASLELARERGRWAALVDDDELPEPGWLEALLACRDRFGADLVVGPVRPVLPQGAPGWLVDGRFFDLHEPDDGARLRDGITGNALLDLEALAAAGVAFDERFGLSGGEDQALFRAAHAAGLQIRFAAAALVFEPVPSERLRLRWLLRRQYRKGNTLGLLAGTRPSLGEGRARRAAAAAWRFARCAALLVLGAATVSRRRAAAALVDGSFALGMVAGLVGLRYEPYRSAGDRLLPSARRWR